MLMEYSEEEKRLARQHRRRVIADWKAEAKTMQSADENERMLMREAKRASLMRIEDAARTISEFEDVNRLWDDREITENWRIAKHEGLTLDGVRNYEMNERGSIIPQPFGLIHWRQLLSGNFLDYIHDCPHEMHELTSRRPIFDLTRELDEDHKEILYYRAIRHWNPQQIAALRDQTDRNIRKVYNTMIASIRKKLYMRLYPRYRDGKPLTFEQKEFCRNYWEQLDDTEKGKITRKFEEEERRKRKHEGTNVE